MSTQEVISPDQDKIIVTKEIKDLIIQGEIIQVVYLLFKEVVKMPNKTTFWVFKDDTRLWGKISCEDFNASIGPYLKEILVTLSKYFPDDKQHFHRIYTKIRSDDFKKTLFSNLYPLCKHKDFENLLDYNPTWLPIKNQLVVCLKTGLTRERISTDYFTKECPINIVSDVSKLAWAEKFFLDLANNDHELATYLKTLVLYFCSGMTFTKSFYQIIGPGGNGKSTFRIMLEGILGNFSIRRYHGDKLPTLKGKRLITGSSIPDLYHTEIARLSKKELEMLDSIRTQKFLIETNFPLEIDGLPKNFVKYVPFNHIFSGDEYIEFDSHKLSQLFTVCLNTGMNSLNNMEIIDPPCVHAKLDFLI